MTSLDDHIKALVAEAVKRAVDDVRAEIVEYVTVAEYARRWSLSQSTVRDAIADRRLEVTRVGRAVRIRADAKIGSACMSATERARLTLLGGGKR